MNFSPALILKKLIKIFSSIGSNKMAIRSSLSKGFTLIELLVVIGILGILAAALVATIDPLEQLEKANDANVKNTITAYLNANTNYYTTHNTWPWDPVDGDNCNNGVAPDAAANPDISINDTPLSTCTTTLIEESELKEGFSGATTVLREIFVTYDATGNFLTGCFRPRSTSQRRDPNTKYTKSGDDVADPTTACEGYGGSTQCYWCAQ